MDMNSRRVTYWDYLKLEKLLTLQDGLEDDYEQISPDESHFIIVHQVFELWFKQIIKELRYVTDTMSQSPVPEEVIPDVVHHVQRIRMILEIAAQHFEIVEALSPQDFLVFRNKLGTASGFQSVQMRIIEQLIGLKYEDRASRGNSDPITYLLRVLQSKDGGNLQKQLEDAMNSTTLADAITDWLARTPILLKDSESEEPNQMDEFANAYLESLRSSYEAQLAVLRKDEEDVAKAKEQVEKNLKQAEDFIFALGQSENREKIKKARIALLFIESYPGLPLLSWPRALIDAVVNMEKQFLVFRFKHARMVERIIGRRLGTGGSAGVDYLDSTTSYRVFKDFWAVRTMLLPQEQLPKLSSTSTYDYRMS